MKEVQQDKLIAYLLNDLSEDDHKILQKQVEESPVLQAELKALRLVLDGIDQQETIAPSDHSREQFYQFLEVESKSQQSVSTPLAPSRLWQSAAAVALLVIGIGFGLVWQSNERQQKQLVTLSSELVETRKLLLLAMLEDPSASERIKAMNVSTKEVESDGRIVEALISRLQNDENENVRLKAAEALADFMHMEGVAEAAIQTLELESSPEVQITLIESLVNGERKEAVPSFKTPAKSR